MRAETLEADVSDGASLALQGFVACRHWASRFIKRNGLVSRSLHAQAASVNVETAASDMAALRESPAQFDPSNVSNMDETGILYRLLPKRTYLLQCEARTKARCTRGMHLKGVLSLIACTSATNAAKVPLRVIGI